MTKERVRKILDIMCDGLYEREDEVRLALLSSIAGESIFLLGPPGVAKSLIARKLKHAYKDATSFEYLMGRFSTPDEIFGPISIKKLKSEDKYERKVENYLPDADIVFLDEIWKASPPIQNSLLTAINEKIYRNGTQEIELKLKGLISASNELPAENEGLEALWDRFIIRLYVDGIKDEDNFNNMIIASEDLYVDKIPDDLKISQKEYNQWQKEIDDIEVPMKVLDIISLIRKSLSLRNETNEDDDSIYVSDRRWKKIVHLMKTCAFLNDRKAVDLMDCFIINNCIWNKDSEIEESRNIVEDVVRKNGYGIKLDIEPIKVEIDALKKEIEKETVEEFKEEYNELVSYDTNGEKNDKGEYYKIKNYKSDDEKPTLINKGDFKSLSKYNKKKVNIMAENNYYNSNYKNYSKSATSSSEFTIDIDGTEYDLETKTQTITKSITKKPSKTLQTQWTKRIGKVHDQCEELQLKIAEFKRKDLEHASSNLFIDPDLSKIAFSNLDRTSHEIAKLKVESEKIRDSYESIE